MKFFISFILFVFSLSLSAQEIAVKGTIADIKTKMFIEYASTRLLDARDSSFVKGAVSNKDGSFKLLTKPGKYIVETSYLGYKKYSQTISVTRDSAQYKLPTIYLMHNATLLDAAIVVAEPPSTVVKGDTVEYNAASFKPDVNDVLEDLIKKIDGLDLDAKGNLTANGKPINKIMVNQKEFFGNDIAMALENLPASMISKLQVYKEESDKAKLTGFKDNDEQQILNLTVKKEIKQSVFGRAGAGYGTNERYSVRSNINYMRNDNQLSGIFNGSNTSRANSQGLQDHKTIGTNFNLKPSKTFEIGGNIRARKNTSDVESGSNGLTYLSTGNRTNTNHSVSKNDSRSIGGGLNLKWTPDTLTTIYARASAGYNDGNNSRTFNTSTYVEAKTDSTTSNGFNTSTSRANNQNGTLTIGRKFSKPGRSITLDLNGSLKDDNNNAKNYSMTNYSLTNDSTKVDQVVNGKASSKNWEASLSYVEPLSKTSFLMLSYSYKDNHSINSKEALRKDAEGNYTVTDTAYTRKTMNDFVGQNINLSFQANKEKFNYTIGLHLLPSSSESLVTIGDSTISHIKQRVLNYSPTIRFRYHPNNTTNLDVNYYGNTSQASIGQLSADTITYSSMNKTYGNPNLKPSFNHKLDINYQRSNYEKKTFLHIWSGINFTMNGIANYTLIDSLGNTLKTYRNVNGNMNTWLGFNYRAPIKKVTIGSTTKFNYSVNNGFTNGDVSTSNNYTIAESLDANFSSDNLDFWTRLGVSHTITKNNLSSSKNMAVTNYNMGGHVRWKLPYHFVLINDLSYTLNTGYSSGFNQNTLLWNASIEKRFLNKKQASFKLYFYNILNGVSNVSRNESSSGFSYSWSNSIKRYCMLSFIYRIQVFK